MTKILNSLSEGKIIIYYGFIQIIKTNRKKYFYEAMLFMLDRMHAVFFILTYTYVH